jgi:hypothetical protein
MILLVNKSLVVLQNRAVSLPHPVVTNISVDIMHDLLEGVCRYDMAEIIFIMYIIKSYLP